MGVNYSRAGMSSKAVFLFAVFLYYLLTLLVNFVGHCARLCEQERTSAKLSCVAICDKRETHLPFEQDERVLVYAS